MKGFIRFLLQKVPRKHLQTFSKVGTSIFSVVYAGNKVFCPVCNRHFRKFLPYGYINSRENALCPSCLALERHRLLWLYLHQETNLFTQTQEVKMLHIAPELPFIKRLKKQSQVNYITADLESPWADLKMDIQEMPLEDNSFDIIMCNHVLEHVNDDIKALKEIYRVLKPGGWAILQCPINYSRETTYEDRSVTSPEEREKHFGQKDHVREYGADYPVRLASAGFEVKTIDFFQQFPPEKQKYYALPDDPIYVVIKNQ